MLALGTGSAARAQAGIADDGCRIGAAFTFGFESGSSWSGCAHLDVVHGLEITALAWRAPGDASRSVLAALHPASIRVQAAGDPVPGERLDPTRPGAPPRPLPESAGSCAGEVIAVPIVASRPDGSTATEATVGTLCARRTRTGLLSKYGDIAGVHGATRWLESAREHANGEIWQSRVGLAEAGRIDVELALTGRVETELVARTAWRVAFALDTPAPDRVEELDFALDAGSRRPMRVGRLEVETLRRTAPARFRVWRVVDATGAGYLLDPNTSVAAPPRFGANWTGFELAVTAADALERHAFAGPTLDGFVDGESLDASDPVLWHALATTVRPSTEDRPALGTRALGFALLPFDWTPRSPFGDIAR